jgi:drug/metabolite transporter (DMT)-like permease
MALREDHRQNAISGAVFGIVSALGYTLADIFLREVATRGDLGWTAWVTCLKALPSFLIAWAIIGWRWSRGRRGLSGARSFLMLCAVGLLMQLGGNIAFQVALSLGGLTLSVPLCFSTLILAGALGGRMFLRESIPRRTQIAMILLIGSVFILQQGADAATKTTNPEPEPWAVAAAVFFACFSGASFGIGGVAMSHSVSGTGTIASTIAPLVTIGVFVPGAIAIQRLGFDGLAEIPWPTQAKMLWAGTFNSIGFFAVTAAMSRISLVRVNLINASQAALCALAGIAWFHEPASIWVGLGTVLTIASLAILGMQDENVPLEIPAVLDAEQPVIAAEVASQAHEETVAEIAEGAIPPQAA